MGFYLHVDDGISLAASRDRCAIVVDSMTQAADALELLGFIVADHWSRSDLDKISGYAPQRFPALLRGPGPRVANLHLSLLELCRADIVNTSYLRMMTGMWLWLMLLNRKLLSRGRSIYQFLDR